MLFPIPAAMASTRWTRKRRKFFVARYLWCVFVFGIISVCCIIVVKILEHEVDAIEQFNKLAWENRHSKADGGHKLSEEADHHANADGKDLNRGC